MDCQNPVLLPVVSVMAWFNQDSNVNVMHPGLRFVLVVVWVLWYWNEWSGLGPSSFFALDIIGQHSGKLEGGCC